MKKLASALLAFSVAGVGLVAVPTATAAESTGGHRTPPGYTPPPIEWGTCASKAMVAAKAECGLLTVPLDYANPNGTKIKIGVSRIKHKTADSAAQGIMLVNPGGPGGSGLNLARLGGFVPNKAGDPYDWIGFDPRGVGTSQPKLTCDGDYFGYNRPDYVPNSRQSNIVWMNKAAGYANACAKAGGELLDHMKTTDWVQDMESIRKAFGAKQINYYGFSYGTYLGQVYATMYPERVRRMVWDGVVNAKRVWYDANLDQDVAFDRNMSIFFDWVAKHDATYHLGTDGAKIRQLWFNMLEQTRKAPFAGKIGPDEWTDAFLSAGYYVYGWEDTAAALVAAVKGDYGPVVAAYDDANGAGPGSDNTYAVYNAVQCTDVQWPTSWHKWEVDNWRVHQQAPFETWANARYNMPCLYWPAKAAKKAVKVKDKGVPPILMIAETNDGATPYSGALQTRATFRKSVLIEGVGGTTHSGSLSGVACTDNRIADYLLTGKLDPRVKGKNRSDVQCDPVPAPDPAPTAAKSGSTGGSTRSGMSRDLRESLENAQAAL
ncbi:alpha/beta hydrolase [Arsenicicoccus piscis]|nr:alpha/beta hydrolase [Arsenicicoccus piscis]MCH8626613.1 alpha/beta hydrolase [Arsenicicoccus piscis]